MTFVVHKGHKYIARQPLVCGSPKADVEVTALYYAVESDFAGYWIFFRGEQMLCSSGYVPHDVITERDSGES